MSRPRRMRRRARWALLGCLLGFASLQLGMSVALDRVRPGWCDPEFACRSRSARALQRARPGRPLVVAVGSSRTELGFCPGELNLGNRALVLNFAQTGAGPVRQLIAVRRLLAAGLRPRLLLVEFLPRFFNQNTENVPLDKLDLLDWDDLRTLEAYYSDLDSAYRAWGERRALCGYSCRKDILRTLLPRFDPVDMAKEHYWRLTDPYGWLPVRADVTPEDRERFTAQARDEYYPYLRPFAVKPVPDQAFRDLLRVCRAEGIDALVYLMPEAAEFRSWYPPDALEAIDQYLAGLTAEFGVPVVDCRTWSPDDDFADGHHLLIPGARAFTQRFGAEVLLPRLPSAQER